MFRKFQPIDGTTLWVLSVWAMFGGIALAIVGAIFAAGWLFAKFPPV